MSDNNVPKLNRSARDSDTRDTTARRKAWAPPSRLDAPPAPPGYKHRWIRAESGGVDDRTNIAGKLREGYELVRGDEYPDFDSGVQDERRTYYSSRTHDQIRAVDNDMLKTNAHSSMKINAPERQSKVSLGGPRTGSE